jgi:tRNA(His) 5'-end guanylyltransferase
MDKLSLAQRMKLYEEATNYTIAPRLPVIGRIDGKAFHTLTKRLKCDRPFDETFSRNMAQAALFLSTQIQGCMLCYTQSDEISFIMRSDQSRDAQPWFGNRIQKIVSVASSVVSAVFNKALKAEDPIAMFDCRIWYVPDMIEVENYFIWRQRDCVKNSITAAAHYEIAKALDDSGIPYGRNRTANMIDGKNQNERQELLCQKAHINWNDYPDHFKRGFVVYREDVEVTTEHGPIMRKKWIIKPAPNFPSEEGKKWLVNVLNPQQEKTDVNLNEAEPV